MIPIGRTFSLSQISHLAACLEEAAQELKDPEKDILAWNILRLEEEIKAIDHRLMHPKQANEFEVYPIRFHTLSLVKAFYEEVLLRKKSAESDGKPQTIAEDQEQFDDCVRRVLTHRVKEVLEQTEY